MNKELEMKRQSKICEDTWEIILKCICRYVLTVKIYFENELGKHFVCLF